MEVLLTSAEMRRGAAHGCERRILALEKGRRGNHGFNRDDFWQLDVEGTLAELAAAKALGLDYNPIVGQLDTDFGDIAKGVQVRSTKYSSGHLLIHESDPDDHMFILVTGSAPNYVLRGWIRGRDGKQEVYWRCQEKRCAFWIPQRVLQPIDDLRAVEEGVS